MVKDKVSLSYWYIHPYFLSSAERLVHFPDHGILGYLQGTQQSFRNDDWAELGMLAWSVVSANFLLLFFPEVILSCAFCSIPSWASCTFWNLFFFLNRLWNVCVLHSASTFVLGIGVLFFILSCKIKGKTLKRRSSTLECPEKIKCTEIKLIGSPLPLSSWKWRPLVDMTCSKNKEPGWEAGYIGVEYW